MNVAEYITSVFPKPLNELRVSRHRDLERMLSCIGNFPFVSNRLVFVIDYSRGEIPFLRHKCREFRGECAYRQLLMLLSRVSFMKSFKSMAASLSGAEAGRQREVFKGGARNTNYIFNTLVTVKSVGSKYPICIAEHPLFVTDDGRVWCSMAVVSRFVKDLPESCGIYNKLHKRYWYVDKGGRLASRLYRMTGMEKLVCSFIFANYSNAQIAKKLGIDEYKVVNILKKFRRRFNVTNTRALMVVFRTLEIL